MTTPSPVCSCVVVDVAVVGYRLQVCAKEERQDEQTATKDEELTWKEAKETGWTDHTFVIFKNGV